ncbi:serine/threonine-protein phosphatase [Deinococcus cavernae]|uniref:Serine/threonine-protein phosphatase n=1 Tax=Deinococcus cavernae TaxID=2320857 RepID=A0A418V795_9DEIO|nr:PP2C family serine/threonine-protein phosphatase [Deinococcus cavernae]RJF71940.1 serine/threonine-protein phosphatase [Deinococcus cavernae]
MQSPQMPLTSSGLLTDIGRQRIGGVNQDAGMALDLPRGGLYAVADGMGGHAAGELAANLALDTLTQNYLEGRGQPPERLAEAVQAANLAVIRHAVGESVGMGTTLLAILIDGGAALVAHVGDSRAYLLRDNELLRLTDDHSWVAEQVRLGFLTEEEAHEHQWKSVVNNALGGEERVRLELFGLPVKAGDRLLICSDGLSGVVPEPELLRFLSRRDAPETVTRLLVDAANDAGGPDNITAVIVDVVRTLPLPRYALPPRTPDGPEYVDVLLTARRGSSLVTYLILTLVYFTLLGMILIPEHRTLIGLLGLLLLAMIVFLQARVQRGLVAARSTRPAVALKRVGTSLRSDPDPPERKLN